MTENCETIFDVLQSTGTVTEEQISEAWELVRDRKGKTDVVEALKELEYVDEKKILQVLSEQYGFQYRDINELTIPPEVTDAFPAEIAGKYGVFPIEFDDDVFTVAIPDPVNFDLVDTLRYTLKKEIQAVVSPKDQIKYMLDKYYGGAAGQVDSLLKDMGAEDASAEMSLVEEKQNEESGVSKAKEDDAPIIKLVSKIIIDAYKMKVSDIHLEPMEKKYRIRYRIDGALREMEGPPKYLQNNVTSRLKIMAHMDISEKRIPLDGRIQLKFGDKSLDLRVSSIPTTWGESIVMRILDKSSITLDIPKLGFYSDDQAIINRIIAYPDGVFLVTGPTGSGKTTSLYAFLNTINKPTRKIITVEDPVEYVLAGINQVQVNPLAKMTFAAALKAMLRQAPNIIMVGEIRDLETAEIAIQAAQTGHLVFSTLHTNDAPSAVTRLIDMGVQPFLVASSVRAIMAQRLMRRVCKKCGEPVQPTEAEVRALGLDDSYLQSATLMQGKGCEVCGGTGYKGRVGIYEIFVLKDEIQELIYKKESAHVIREAARKGGMRTLREDGLRKAAAGTTTLSEVIKTTMGDKE